VPETSGNPAREDTKIQKEDGITGDFTLRKGRRVLDSRKETKQKFHMPQKDGEGTVSNIKPEKIKVLPKVESQGHSG